MLVHSEEALSKQHLASLAAMVTQHSGALAPLWNGVVSQKGPMHNKIQQEVRFCCSILDMPPKLQSHFVRLLN